MEKENKKMRRFFTKPSNLNYRYQNIDKFSKQNTNISNKNDEQENFINNNNMKINFNENIQLSPDKTAYKSETFNSHAQFKSKLNILDNLLDKKDLKGNPISKEKKIYLYLKNSINNIKSETNSVIDTPKNLFKKKEDIFEELSINDGKKEEIINNYNKTNIFNNINNNNVNNIFVNFISSNAENDISPNMNKDKLNNSFNSNDIQNNSIEQDGLNQTSVKKDSKIILLKDKQFPSELKKI
jgi:hypothetical protein